MDPAVLRGRVVTFGLEGREPWQGRALEGSGGSGARFWTPAILRARVVTFGLEGRETVAGAYFRGLWRSSLELQIGKLGWGGSGRWRTTSEAVWLGRARWSPEDVVKSKPAVEEHALTRADMHAHAHARATIKAHLWRHIPTNTQERTHTNPHQPTQRTLTCKIA